MAKVFYESDVQREYLKDKTIAVIGYGSQGHAHALNLHDSGHRVLVGLHSESKSWKKAVGDGLTVKTVPEAVAAADVVMVLIPDPAQGRVYRESIEPHLKKGHTLMFAHGFNIHFRQIQPPPWIDVSMIAPKSPGHRMRELFTEGVGVPALLAIHQDFTGKATGTALAYAQGVGCTRAGVIQTTFKEETETDLFGEQAVLCGGVSTLIKKGFQTLVDAGYQPEVAYFECLHEMKLIVDLIYEGGLSYMRYSVSDTAEYGDYTRGPQVLDSGVDAKMKQVLEGVQSGEFAREWLAENESGLPRMKQFRETESKLLIEQVGKQLREMMQWLAAANQKREKKLAAQ